MEKYELIIIGGGAAAFAAACRAWELGVKTALINKGLPLGGTCLNVGCIPSKQLLEVAREYHYCRFPHFRSIRNTDRIEFDFREAVREKDEIVGYLRDTNYCDVITRFPNVTLYQAWARFISPHQVEVDGAVLEGEKFIITTGSRPRIIPFKGIERVHYLTNQEALSLERLPETMIVVGGGPLGLEFAQMYQRFGTRVAVLEREAQLLPKGEPEVGEEMERCLTDEGITIHTNASVQEVGEEGSLKMVDIIVDGKRLALEAQELLLATGVVANTDGLDLPKAGVQVDRQGFIVTDGEMRSSAPHIHAAGDVAGKMMLEAVAAREGAIAASNALEGAHRTLDYGTIPHAIFTDPQVASVGATEEQLRQKQGACISRTLRMAHVPKAKAQGETRGLIKMVVDPTTEAIMGVHIVSPLAAELIPEATLMVKHKLTLDDLLDTVYVCPTTAEAMKLVAQSFKRDITRMSCC